MPVFGLTGNLASGKSTVLGLLAKKGAAIFDADRLIHNWYRDSSTGIYKKVAAVFPQVCRDGFISRKDLGSIVFHDIRKLRRLEKIVHPSIINELKNWATNMRKRKVIAVAETPLLFEKKLENIFDAVILVYVKKDILIGRIARHHRCSKHYALKRLEFYLPIKEKAKKADFIIDNSANRASLIKKVDTLWKVLKKAK
ncbi:MAG: dephospho-CoA kinase [Candidatus Omnitrophica bacterium]|nr:dephospho-CoA kinase [Candidatus Omnitrophota bacterium]